MWLARLITQHMAAVEPSWALSLMNQGKWGCLIKVSYVLYKGQKILSKQSTWGLWGPQQEDYTLTAQCLEVTGVVSEQTEGKVSASIKACVTPGERGAGFRRTKHAFVGGRSAKGLSAQGDWRQERTFQAPLSFIISPSEPLDAPTF